MTVIGHEGAVNSLAYSPDSHLLASASTDGTIRIWDMRTGEEMISPLCSNDGAVWSVAFSPDGMNIVAGTEDGIIYVWNLANMHVAAQRWDCLSGAVSSVLYSPDGSCLASASLNRAMLWNVETGERRTLMSHPSKVHALAFSSDGLLLATGSEDGKIQLWDVSTGGPRYKSSKSCGNPIYSLGFLPHSRTIAAGSGNNIIICKPNSGKDTITLHSGPCSVISIDTS